jgi:hypothetical protein
LFFFLTILGFLTLVPKRDSWFVQGATATTQRCAGRQASLAVI